MNKRMNKEKEWNKGKNEEITAKHCAVCAALNWSVWALGSRRAAVPVGHLHLVGSGSGCYSSDYMPHANSKQRLWAIALQHLQRKGFQKLLECHCSAIPA